MIEWHAEVVDTIRDSVVRVRARKLTYAQVIEALRASTLVEEYEITIVDYFSGVRLLIPLKHVDSAVEKIEELFPDCHISILQKIVWKDLLAMLKEITDISFNGIEEITIMVEPYGSRHNSFEITLTNTERNKEIYTSMASIQGELKVGNITSDYPTCRDIRLRVKSTEQNIQYGLKCYLVVVPLTTLTRSIRITCLTSIAKWFSSFKENV